MVEAETEPRQALTAVLDDLIRWYPPAAARSAACPSLEALLTEPDYLGLTDATPLQRAICRIIEGRPLAELAEHPDVATALGGFEAARVVAPGLSVSEYLILAGIRTAKSMIAAAVAIRATQTCDIRRLGPGEVARFSLVAPKLDLAKAVFDHVCGNVLERPRLRALLVGSPTVDTILLRHPSGRPVEIKTVAGAKAGATLVARWSAGCVFDEAPRMVGADEGVVNYDDCHAAVIARLLPGAQIGSIGSPWAPFGPVYRRVTERHGKPGPDLVVIRGTGPAMNPTTWTPERVEEIRRTEPDVYRTDVLGEFTDPESSLLTQSELAAVTRDGPWDLPPEPGWHYAAAMDPGTRGNAWTLAVQGCPAKGKRSTVLCRQWVGSKAKPLSPDVVLKEIAALLRPYGLRDVVTDQWAADALRDLGDRHGLRVYERPWTAAEKLDAFEALRLAIADRSVDLPGDPVLRADLLNVRKRVTQSGVAIELLQTSDGRHCDYAPALALVQRQYIAKPDDVQAEPAVGTPEWIEKTSKAEFEATMRELDKRAARQGKALLRHYARSR